jgi:release factor glutamine methyltransferase
MRLLDVIQPSCEHLAKFGIDDPLAEAEALVFFATGIDRLAAYINNPEVERSLVSRIRSLLRRRSKGEPLQYIIGNVAFLGLTIHVGKGVLIPRPETELLAEEAITIVKSKRSEAGGQKRPGLKAFPRILDLCTGSGCIALALAWEFTSAFVCGTDISKKAIQYAQKNALTNRIRNAEFFSGSLFEPVKKIPGFDLIVSNPPYVPTTDINGLQREIRDWEPAEALDGGKDGLDFYRTIFSNAGSYLRERGTLILELGYGQAGEVTTIAEKAGFENIEVKKDYAGTERILKAEA